MMTKKLINLLWRQRRTLYGRKTRSISGNKQLDTSKLDQHYWGHFIGKEKLRLSFKISRDAEDYLGGEDSVA